MTCEDRQTESNLNHIQVTIEQYNNHNLDQDNDQDLDPKDPPQKLTTFSGTLKLGCKGIWHTCNVSVNDKFVSLQNRKQSLEDASAAYTLKKALQKNTLCNPNLGITVEI